MSAQKSTIYYNAENVYNANHMLKFNVQKNTKKLINILFNFIKIFRARGSLQFSELYS